MFILPHSTDLLSTLNLHVAVSDKNEKKKKRKEAMQNKETAMGSDTGPTVLPPAACRYSFGVCVNICER